MHGDRFNVPYKYDTNKGAGYGKVEPTIDKPRMAMQSFPYRDSVSRPGFSSEEEEPEIDDPELMDKFVRKVNLAFVASDPKAWRSDKAGFVHNQRLALPEGNIPTRSNSISPIPFRSLYKHFDGPALGADMRQRYTTGDPFQTGTFKGFASAPPDIMQDDDLEIDDLDDLPTKDQRSIIKQNLKIRALTRG
jgi:hypothetical protein